MKFTITCKNLYLNVYLHAVMVNLRAIFSPWVSRVLEARPLVCQLYHVTHQTITQKVRLCQTFALSDICIVGHLGESKCSCQPRHPRIRQIFHSADPLSLWPHQTEKGLNLCSWRWMVVAKRQMTTTTPALGAKGGYGWIFGTKNDGG